MTDVIVEKSGSAVLVRLDRAEKRNALTPEMIDDLHLALDAAEAARASVLVLSAHGPLFCAGADIAGYRDAADDASALALFTDRARGLCARLASSPVVVVAVAQGSALGGGFELLLSADIIVAVEGARFGLPELRLGLIPGWGGTQRLSAQIGSNRAKRAILLGETFTAEELQEFGMISAVAATADDLGAIVDDLVTRLTAAAPRALAAAKTSIGLGVEPSGGDAVGFRSERDLLLDLFDSVDGREGVRAFVEKRAPHWTGW